MTYSALHDAAFNGAAAQLLQLIQEGVNVNETAADQTIPLHHAAAKGSTECVDVLIKNGSKVNVKDGNGCAPLHHAAFGGHASTLRTLLEGGKLTHFSFKIFSPLRNLILGVFRC